MENFAEILVLGNSEKIFLGTDLKLEAELLSLLKKRKKKWGIFNYYLLKIKKILFDFLAIGPYDFKVFGPQKAFVKRNVDFLIRNESVEIEEIYVLSKI